MPRFSVQTTPTITPSGALKFVFDDSASPHIKGIQVPASKCAPDQPVRIRSTPYEARVERALDAEQVSTL